MICTVTRVESAALDEAAMRIVLLQKALDEAVSLNTALTLKLSKVRAKRDKLRRQRNSLRGIGSIGIDGGGIVLDSIEQAVLLRELDGVISRLQLMRVGLIGG